MVVDTTTRERTDETFRALGDATRRDIVMLTLQRDYSVSDLARLYPMSFAAVQKHVAVLERAHLVTKRRSGREQLVRGNVLAIRQAYGLLEELEEVWRGRVERIDQILTQEKEQGKDQEKGKGKRK
ncbi:MAG: metalloregulator ArsR/SmtB family transcription factor [Acidimicrobiales bacterium]